MFNSISNLLVFPLYSIIFLFFGINLIWTFLITIPIVYLLKQNISIFIIPLWMIPIFSLFHFIFAGLICKNDLF